jgi:hypothetical protein
MYVHALHTVHALPDCVSLRDVCGTVCHQNRPDVIVQIHSSVPIVTLNHTDRHGYSICTP